MTWGELCDLVSWWLGDPWTPDKVWNISPSGELWPVAELSLRAELWVTQEYGTRLSPVAER